MTKAMLEWYLAHGVNPVAVKAAVPTLLKPVLIAGKVVAGIGGSIIVSILTNGF